VSGEDPTGQGANIRLILAKVRGGINSLMAEVLEEITSDFICSRLKKVRPSRMNSLKIWLTP
jgi:hypothetical protein